MKKKAAIITLGCAKNTVDSEQIASILHDAGVEVCDDPQDAPVALLNTCGFIDAAKEESIDTIIEMAGLKDTAGLEKLIVCGCLAKRYPDALRAELPEIDLLTGGGPRGAAAAVMEALGLPRPRPVSHLVRSHRFTPPAWAYLRISEGCDNRCNYCAIPSIKGPLVSRPEAEILAEAGQLAAEGVREINIIAQDTTSYGRDRGSARLHALLENLCEELPQLWIRLLYTHPAHYYKALIEVIAAGNQICPYLDIPLQHINDGVLAAMGRKVSRVEVEELIATLRAEMPSIVLRTTFIVGFPTEDGPAFEELVDFVGNVRFDRAGAFIYSSEEGTPAARLPYDTPKELKQQRLDRLMTVQRRIACELAAGRKGEVTPVLLEEKSPTENGRWIARSPAEAPEVDPVIFLKDTGELQAGQIVQAAITGGEGYDCIAEPLPDPHN